MKKILIAIVFLTLSSSVFAEGFDFASENKRYGASTGIKLMNYLDYESDADGTFYSAYIPMYEYLFPLFSNDLLLYLSSNLNWGLSEFFFDFGLGTGLRYYPVGNDVFSVYGGVGAGTFFFNNVSTIYRGGRRYRF
jgi:hypothetical protein